jgi:hypothetical protein
VLDASFCPSRSARDSVFGPARSSKSIFMRLDVGNAGKRLLVRSLRRVMA